MEYPFRSILDCFFSFMSARQRVVFSDSTQDCRHPLGGENHYLRDSDWVRTNDLLFRRELLYPAELRNQINTIVFESFYLIFMPYGLLFYFQVYLIGNLTKRKYLFAYPSYLCSLVQSHHS